MNSRLTIDRLFETMPSLASAAIKFGNGHLYTGPSHFDAIASAIDAKEDVDNSEFNEGFIDLDGNFLTREQAYQMVKRLNQLKLEIPTGQLDSAYLDPSYTESVARVIVRRVLN